MEEKIEFLLSLQCGIQAVGEECPCEKCWKRRKFFAEGGQRMMLNWQMERINAVVNKLWEEEKRRRYAKVIK